MLRLKWLLSKLSKYRYLYLAAIILMIFEALTNILMPYYIKDIIDKAIPYNDKNFLIKQIIFLLVIFIISALCTILIEYIFSNIGNKLIYDIKLEMVNSFFKYTGENIKEKYITMMTVFVNDVYVIEQLITRRFAKFLIDFVSLITIIGYLFYLNITLTLIIISAYPILIIAQLIFNKSIKSFTKSIMNEYDKTNINIKELIENLYEYIAYNGKKYFLNRYKPIEKKIVEKKIELNIIFSYNSILPSFLSSLILLIILGIGSNYVINEVLTIGELTIFYIYTNRAFAPVARIILFFADLEKTKISFNRIFDLML